MHIQAEIQSRQDISLANVMCAFADRYEKRQVFALTQIDNWSLISSANQTEWALARLKCPMGGHHDNADNPVRMLFTE